MYVARYVDLEAFQLAVEFKLEVYRIVNACREPIDFKFRSQLFDAAAQFLRSTHAYRRRQQEARLRRR